MQEIWNYLVLHTDLGTVGLILLGGFGLYNRLKTELEGDILNLRTELKGDILNLRTELKGDISSLRTELKGDINELKQDIHKLVEKTDNLHGRICHLEGAILTKEFCKLNYEYKEKAQNQ